MAITNLLDEADRHSEASIHATSRTKIIFVVGLFILSLTAFVCQTEFTSQAYKLKFSEPVLLLAVTHGSWWLLWPLQVLFISVWRTIGKMGNRDKLVKVNTAMGNIQYQRLNSTSGLLEDQEHPQQEVPVQQVNYWKYFRKQLLNNSTMSITHQCLYMKPMSMIIDQPKHLNDIIESNVHISGSSSITDCIRTFFQAPSIKYILFKTLIVTTYSPWSDSPGMDQCQ
ncbi:unnamed protein product [Candida parapsilosis]